MKQKRKRARLQRRNLLVTISGLLLYLLSIFAPVGIVLTIFVIINGRLPRHISIVEFTILAIAMLIIIPVWLWHKRLKNGK